MIISFDCENLILSKEDLSIPYVICLRHCTSSAVVYQVASIFYRSKDNFTTSTIVTKTYDCNWIMFHWLPGIDGVLKKHTEHVCEKSSLASESKSTKGSILLKASFLRGLWTNNLLLNLCWLTHCKYHVCVASRDHVMEMYSGKNEKCE